MKVEVKKIFVKDGELSEHSKIGLLVLVWATAAFGIVGAVAGCFRGWCTEASFLGGVFGWCFKGLIFGSLIGLLLGLIFCLISYADSK